MARGKKVITGKGGSVDEVVLTTDDSEVTKTVVQTADDAERKEKGRNTVMEKSTESEKDNAPIVIVTWTDTQGRRRTKQFTCANLSLSEHKSESFTKATHKTVLDISLEAQVIEVI